MQQTLTWWCSSVCRYVHEKGCVATTDDITVSVSTSFLPELSSVHPPHFFFTYRIRYGIDPPGGNAFAYFWVLTSQRCVFRIEMSSGASPEAACQLDSRYWKITTSDGNVEEVQGPGVVGMSPDSCAVIGRDQLLNVCVSVQASFRWWRRGRCTSTLAAPPSPRRRSTWRVTTPSTDWVSTVSSSEMAMLHLFLLWWAFLLKPTRRRSSRWPSLASTWSAPPTESHWFER